MTKQQLRNLVKGARFGRHEENALLKLIDNTPTAGVSAAAALTAADGSTVDTTYGQEEADVISNLVTRQGEIEAALVAAGILTSA